MEPPGSPDPQELLALAVKRVRKGALPKDPSARLFAGPGRNSTCALCDDVIGLKDIEYEVDSTKPDSPTKLIHFHRSCYFAWLQACE